MISVIITLDYPSSALADGQVGSGLLYLSVKSHEQSVSVFSGVKTNIGGLITVTTCFKVRSLINSYFPDKLARGQTL